jgi:hypothetical protein
VAFAAAAIPTRSATSTKICAIVVADCTIAALTDDMKVKVAIKRITEIAITYPRIGWTVSKRPIVNFSTPNVCDYIWIVMNINLSLRNT